MLYNEIKVGRYYKYNYNADVIYKVIEKNDCVITLKFIRNKFNSEYVGGYTDLYVSEFNHYWYCDVKEISKEELSGYLL